MTLELRAAASRQVAAAFPDRAVGLAGELLVKAEESDLPASYAILAATPTVEAATVLTTPPPVLK